MRAIGVLMVVLAAGAAEAQAVDGKTAKTLLFPATGAVVELLPQDFLPEDQAALLATVGAQQPYYGAIAVSPDEGLMVEATVAAANYHETEAAERAALAGCEAKRQGARPCAVVAVIRPEGWQARPLQLSAAATEGFADYGRSGPRALAVSASTGLWGLGKGDSAADAAIAECAAKANPAATDCAVVIAD